MNKEQTKALTKLSSVFSICKKARLGFVGMDGNLLAYDADELKQIFELGAVCDVQYRADGNQGEPVNTHGCYLDSGGW